MALAFWMYSIAVALARVRNIILERERQTEWVRHASGMSVGEFFAMGGYAPYVWGSFGACALAMASSPGCCAAAAGDPALAARARRRRARERSDALEGTR